MCTPWRLVHNPLLLNPVSNLLSVVVNGWCTTVNTKLYLPTLPQTFGFSPLLPLFPPPMSPSLSLSSPSQPSSLPPLPLSVFISLCSPPPAYLVESEPRFPRWYQSIKDMGVLSLILKIILRPVKKTRQERQWGQVWTKACHYRLWCLCRAWGSPSASIFPSCMVFPLPSILCGWKGQAEGSVYRTCAQEAITVTSWSAVSKYSSIPHRHLSWETAIRFAAALSHCTLQMYN